MYHLELELTRFQKKTVRLLSHTMSILDSSHPTPSIPHPLKILPTSISRTHSKEKSMEGRGTEQT